VYRRRPRSVDVWRPGSAEVGLNASHARDWSPEAKVVPCNEAVALGLLPHLTELKLNTPETVAAATSWCEAKGAHSVDDIVSSGMLDDFVKALKLKPIPAKKLHAALLASAKPSWEGVAMGAVPASDAAPAVAALFRGAHGTAPVPAKEKTTTTVITETTTMMISEC